MRFAASDPVRGALGGRLRRRREGSFSMGKSSGEQNARPCAGVNFKNFSIFFGFIWETVIMDNPRSPIPRRHSLDRKMNC